MAHSWSMQSMEPTLQLCFVTVVAALFDAWCWRCSIKQIVLLYRHSLSNGKYGLCTTEHWKKNVKRENLNRTNTKSPTDIKTESLKARSPPDSRGGGCSRQGWITDTKVSTGCECGSYWSSCMWLLGCWIWLCDGSYWLGKTVHKLWWIAALAATTNFYICMTPDIWAPLSQSFISYDSCLPLVSLLPPCFSPTFHSPFLLWLDLPVMFPVFLRSHSLSLFSVYASIALALPITFSLPCISRLSFQWLWYRQWILKDSGMILHYGSFASHSWCGGGPQSLTEGEREAGV